MSHKRLSVGFMAAALGLGIFVVGASAQDSSSAAPAEGAVKAEKPFKGGRGHRGPGRMGMMGGLRGIELTDAQKEQLKAIHEANKPNEATMTEMRTIMAAKRDGTITEEQTARLQSLRTEQRTKMESVRMQIEAILTPEQKAQIEQKKAEMKQRFEQHRQMRQQRKAEGTAPAAAPSN